MALTAPYMHDGSIRTLDAVVDVYNRGGGDNPNLDPVRGWVHVASGRSATPSIASRVRK